MTHQEHGIEQIRRLARHAERRIRLHRMLRTGASALCAALLFAIAVVASRKLGLLPESAARAALCLASFGVGVGCVVGWGWRLNDRAGARRLDRFYSLHDRLANALAFGEVTPRTAFMNAAIDDAATAAGTADPRRAVPIGWPRPVIAAAALTVPLAAVLFLEVRAHAPAPHAKTIDPIEVSPDDLDDVKDFLKQIEQRSASGDTRGAVDEFNRLVDDIVSRRLDRTEAFRRMQALQEKLLDGTAAERRALEKQVDSMGEELKKATLTRPAGEAMTDARLGKARDALRALSEKMRETARGGGVDKAQLEQMREALKRAAEQADKRSREMTDRRQQVAEDILKSKQRLGDAGSDEERSLLEKKQRELERLDGDSEEQKSAGRQLDRLDRELEQAAEDLMKDLGASADDLEQGAEDLNRLDEQQASQQEKEELRQKLQELRELLRQQGQGGKGQMVRLKRFAQMARGQGAGGQKGADGPGKQPGQGDAPSDGQGGQDPSGQGGRAGQGSQGGQGGETWIVGPGGEKILMLSRSSAGAGAGSGGPSDGPGSPGRWGTGHDPKVQGQATSSKMGTEDTQVQGSETGQGSSRSQVILGASERGFATKGYKKVYTEYHQVAEESAAKEEIPGGYRFYVKRYFQLIRPRDE